MGYVVASKEERFRRFVHDVLLVYYSGTDGTTREQRQRGCVRRHHLTHAHLLRRHPGTK